MFKYVMRTLIHVFLPPNTRTLVLPFDPTERSTAVSFLVCNHLLPYLQFLLRFLNAAYKRYTLLVTERHCYLSLGFLTSKNISRTLIVVLVPCNYIISRVL